MEPNGEEKWKVYATGNFIGKLKCMQIFSVVAEKLDKIDTKFDRYRITSTYKIKKKKERLSKFAVKR